MQYKGLLSGLRVIDCGTYIAGPAATTVMSDFGADVIKIERPQGDQWRLFSSLPGTAKSELDWAWVLTNRNKRSLALDLTSEAGREALLRLVRSADVFATNFQQPLLDTFRIRYEDLSRENSRLVYAHLTGYGDSGEDATAPAFDALAYWARSGLMMSVTGRDGTPGAPAPGMGDHPTAMSLFGAIMLALYDREKTGRGARVGTSLMASGAWANACNIQARFCNAKFPDRTPGAPPPNPLAAGYLAQDGKAFFIAQLEPDREFPRLCKALGIEEIASSELFCDNAARSANAAELYGLLQSQFESHDLAELRRLFKDADVKWSPMPVLEDVIADPQLAAAGAVTSFSDHAELRTISSPVFVAGSEKRPFAMAPDVGAHTREVLRELGYTDAAIESMIKAGDAADRAR